MKTTKQWKHTHVLILSEIVWALGCSTFSYEATYNTKGVGQEENSQTEREASYSLQDANTKDKGLQTAYILYDLDRMGNNIKIGAKILDKDGAIPKEVSYHITCGNEQTIVKASINASGEATAKARFEDVSRDVIVACKASATINKSREKVAVITGEKLKMGRVYILNWGESWHTKACNATTNVFISNADGGGGLYTWKEPTGGVGNQTLLVLPAQATNTSCTVGGYEFERAANSFSNIIPGKALGGSCTFPSCYEITNDGELKLASAPVAAGKKIIIRKGGNYTLYITQ